MVLTYSIEDLETLRPLLQLSHPQGRSWPVLVGLVATERQSLPTGSYGALERPSNDLVSGRKVVSFHKSRRA